MKIKLILIQEFYNDDYELNFIKDIIKEQEFEEVTEEEFLLISKNIHRINTPHCINGTFYWKIVIKDDVPIKNRIQSIKDILESDLIRIEKEKLEREAKRKAKEESMRKRTREQEIKLLEELKKKYEKNDN